MDDATAGLPEPDSVLSPGGGEEVVDLLVHVLGPGQVLVALDLGLDEMVAVDGGGDGHPGQAAADELQHRHLGSGVLHRHSVGSEPQVAGASLNVLLGRVVQVRVQDLLRQSHRPAQPLLHHLQVGHQLLVGEGRALVELGHGRIGHDGGVETSLLLADN